MISNLRAATAARPQLTKVRPYSNAVRNNVVVKLTIVDLNT